MLEIIQIKKFWNSLLKTFQLEGLFIPGIPLFPTISADRDEQPGMIENIGWIDARNYFTAWAVSLGKSLLLSI